MGPASSVLTTVSTLDPIRVYFQISEQSYLTFWRHHAAGSGAETNVRIAIDLCPTARFIPQPGRFFFAGRQIDANTGTLQIAGLFPNPNYMLRPGQYGGCARKRIRETNALLVPQRAVTECKAPIKWRSWTKPMPADLQTVKVGEQMGADWLIEDGLEPGDRVVVEGAQKARRGRVVAAKPIESVTQSTVHSPQSAVRSPQSTTRVRRPQSTVRRRWSVDCALWTADCGPLGKPSLSLMYRFFINRPIVAMVIAILTVIVGLVSMVSLPVAQFPNIVPPEIRIQTTFVGADAQSLAQSVATPIEEQMSGVDNMNYMYSISANNGVMRMGVNFDVKTDPNIDQCWRNFARTRRRSQLPPAVRNYGVTLLKSPTTPMMLVALYSPKGTHDATFLANYAYINLVDQITQLKGISNINVFGAGQYAMRFWVNPTSWPS